MRIHSHPREIIDQIYFSTQSLTGKYKVKDAEQVHKVKYQLITPSEEERAIATVVQYKLRMLINSLPPRSVLPSGSVVLANTHDLDAIVGRKQLVYRGTLIKAPQQPSQPIQQQQYSQRMAQLTAQQQQAVPKEKETPGVRYFINPFNIAATIEKADIDDLKKIKGIGPVIEKKLNMIGIVSFKQISELPDEALDQIAHTLKFFPDRIKRDKWVEQAKTLANIKFKIAQ